MRLLLVLAIGSIVVLVRRADVRRAVLDVLRSTAVLCGVRAPDFGSLQRQVLIGVCRQRTVSVNRTVRLRPSMHVLVAEADRAVVEPVADVFFADVADAVVARADAEGWLLDGRPRLTWSFSPDVRPGFPSVGAVAPRPAPPPPAGTAPYATELAAGGPLVLVEADGSRRIPLDDHSRPLTIGRSRQCDVVLQDGSVSARHAEVCCTDGRWTIRDGGSTNGTFVDGRSASAPLAIRPGQTVALGPEVRFAVTA